MNIPVNYFRRMLLTATALSFVCNLVMAAPKIEVDRTEVHMGKLYVDPYGQAAGSLGGYIVKNAGDETLSVSSVSKDGYPYREGYKLQPEESRFFPANPVFLEMGNHAWGLTINSNDPEVPHLPIAVSYEGIAQPPLIVEELDGTQLVSGETLFQYDPMVTDPNRAYPTTPPRELSRVIRVRNSGEAAMPLRVNSSDGYSWNGHGIQVEGRSYVHVSPLSHDLTVFIPALGTLDLMVKLSPSSIGNIKSKVILSSYGHPHPLIRKPSFEFFVQTVASGIPRFAVEDGKAYHDWDPEAVAPLDFDTLHLGERQDSSVTIRNDGTAPLTVSAEMVGGNQDDFLLTKTFPVTLAAGAKSVVGVRFAPKDGGPRSSILRFTTDDPDQEIFDLSVRGQGFRLVVEDPEGSNFGKRPVGGIASRTFALENKGETAISGIMVDLTSRASGQLALIGDVPYSLQPGERVEFSVQFSPNKVGSLFSYLKVTTLENLTKPLLLGITASGTDAPALVLSGERGQISMPGMTSMEVPYDSVDIGDYKRFAFDLKNQGTVPLDFSADFQNGSSDDFSLLKPLPDSVPPGGRVRFEVTFRPKDSGSKAAVFRIQSNDPDQPEFDILLSGYGFPFSVESPEGTEFGETQVGESEVLTFVLVNNGSEPLSQISAVLDAGGSARAAGVGSARAAVMGSTEFRLVSPIPDRLRPKERVEFQVMFKPRTAGAHSVVLRLQSAKHRKQFVDVQLKARGKAAKPPKILVKDSKGRKLTKGSAPAGFGRVEAGSKVSRWFSIKNKESLPLNISKISLAGRQASIFRIAGVSNQVIKPGETFRFKAICKPVDAGEFSASFVIKADYGKKKKVPSIRIKVGGVALPAAEGASPSGIGKKEPIDG
jgi:hypothetical protein